MGRQESPGSARKRQEAPGSAKYTLTSDLLDKKDVIWTTASEKHTLTAATATFSTHQARKGRACKGS